MVWSERHGVTLPTHLTISLATTSDSLAIHTQNHETKDWIFACVVDNSVNNMRVWYDINNYLQYISIYF